MDLLQFVANLMFVAVWAIIAQFAVCQPYRQNVEATDPRFM